MFFAGEGIRFTTTSTVHGAFLSGLDAARSLGVSSPDIPPARARAGGGGGRARAGGPGGAPPPGPPAARAPPPLARLGSRSARAPPSRLFSRRVSRYHRGR
ncbi:MAG: hypothetical protein IPG81_13560 [Sandaracinaceae bacterium]|nr:hypothetical protein [Sandaracinaceae bacterium]